LTGIAQPPIQKRLQDFAPSDMSAIDAVEFLIQPLGKRANSQCLVLATKLVLPAVDGTSIIPNNINIVAANPRWPVTYT
jgi:hypothetical protein